MTFYCDQHSPNKTKMINKRLEFYRNEENKYNKIARNKELLENEIASKCNELKKLNEQLNEIKK